MGSRFSGCRFELLIREARRRRAVCVRACVTACVAFCSLACSIMFRFGLWLMTGVDLF